MSDPNAVSVLAKLKSWYPLTGDMLDAHGPNDLVIGVSASYEAGGKVGGTRLAAGSRGACLIADTIAYSATTGKFFTGGWIYYTGAAPANAEFELALNTGDPWHESLAIDSSGASNTFSAFNWTSTTPVANVAYDPNVSGLAYNFTAEVTDSLGTTASCADQIIIRDAGNPYAEGWYFVIGQWDEGIMTIYVHGKLVDTAAQATTVFGTLITCFQIGDQWSARNSQGAQSQIFYGDGAILTQADIDYLYNDGDGKSHANVVADAA